MSIVCPKCGNEGMSLSAIYSKETSETNGSADITGSGLMFGTGGLGLGLGMGSADIHTITQTERAKMFTKPRMIQPSIGNGLFMIAGGIAMVIAFEYLPVILNGIAGAASASSGASSPPDIEAFASLYSLITNPYVIAVYAIITLGVTLFTGKKEINNAIKEADDYNQHVFPKIQAKYEDIFYCEHCNTLFDEKGNNAPGNKDGLSKLMNI